MIRALAFLLLATPARAEPLALWSGDTLTGTADLAPGVTVDAAAHPCANCHGWDGAGGGEGATRAPDLGRSALLAKGYDATRFATALATGTTPDGRALARAMPRYALPPDAAAALWSLTAPLEENRRQGITPTEVRLALVHDPATRGLALSYAAAMADLSPTLWGRKVTLALVPQDQPFADLPFAVIGPFGPAPMALETLTAAQVPLLHGFAPAPDSAVALPLALTEAEELSVLAGLASDAGLSQLSLSGGKPEAIEAARNSLARDGLTVTDDAPATLVLSPDAQPPRASILLLPEAVALARPDLAGRPGTLTTTHLPFLQGQGDSAAAYAGLSLSLLLQALEEAGPDPTRRRFAEAAQRLRNGLLAAP
jgi:mono/diheme cytochrome c family protein